MQSTTFYSLKNYTDSMHFYGTANIIYLKKIFGTKIQKIVFDGNSYSIFLAPENEFFFLYYLSRHTLLKLNSLVDLSCLDTLTVQSRFCLYYQLISVTYSTRLSVFVSYDELTSPSSVVKIFPNANWAEREVWDLFGVYFKDHPDLRRILTDYGFKGHPLRKDFPLSGFVELFYDESKSSLLYFPVALTQEYRDFKFSNPWKLNKSNVS